MNTHDKIIIRLVIATIIICGFTACENTSDDVANSQQEQLSMRAVESVGMPALTKFVEKRNLKSILELRDKEVATHTYIVDMQGHFHLVCNSVGYGIPYATQYTNPMHRVYQGVTLPQADPNGLFSPATADGTWVMCVNPETNQVTATYIEPRIVVSQFELK